MSDSTEKKKTGIDPHQLLTALAPLLKQGGAVQGPNEMVRLVSLMKKAKNMVQRCTYLNVMKATKEERVLQKFLTCGGWQVLDDWLQESFKDKEDTVFLLEVLEIYQQLPVTVETLKSRSTAKAIRQLSKSEDHCVKKVSTTIVESWMVLVKGAQKPAEKDSSSKVSKEKLPKSSDTDKPAKKKLKTDGSLQSTSKDKKPEGLKQKQKPDFASALASADDTLKPNVPKKDLKDLNTNSNKDGAVDGKSSSNKIRTAKTAPTKFRSTGLESGSVLPPIKRKTSVTPDKPSTKRPSTSPVGAPEKKPKIEEKPAPPTTDKPADKPSLVVKKEETYGKIKLVSPKPKPMHEMHESTGFMDALIVATSPAVKIKKKKPTVKIGQTGNQPSSPTSPKDSKSLQLKGEDGKLSPAVEDGSEDSQSQSKVEGESSSETSSVSTSIKKEKKRVSWADERHLRKYFYFEMDENERVNVNKVKGKSMLDDLKNEGRLLKQGFHHSLDDTGNSNGKSKEMPWRPPPLLTGLPTPTVQPGHNSTERETQAKREQGVLLALYFNRIPDCPEEADSEDVPYSEPKTIPLEDANGSDNVVDHSTFSTRPIRGSHGPLLATPVAPPSIPATNFSLPPDVANILSQMASKLTAEKVVTTASVTTPSNPSTDIQSVLQNIMGTTNGTTGSVPPSEVNHEVIQQFQDMVQQGVLPPPPFGFPPPNMPPPMGPDGRPLGPPPPFPPFPGRFQGPPRGPYRQGFRPGPPRGNWRGRGGRGGYNHREPCPHFVAGYCNRGNGCRFFHPGVNGPPQ